VVGLVLDVLRSLGAELDRQVDEDDPIDVAPDEVIAR
jgi:multicomponent Na+:H+ antiporter subunit A